MNYAPPRVLALNGLKLISYRLLERKNESDYASVFTDNGYKRTRQPLKMTSFCNASKDKPQPVLSFSLTLVIKKSQLRGSSLTTAITRSPRRLFMKYIILL